MYGTHAEFLEACTAFEERFGMTFLTAIAEAFNPPRPEAVLVGPGGRKTVIPAFDPVGCPLTALAEAIRLDEWDCSFF